MVALFLRPDADQSDGGWLNESASATNLFNSVDEPTTPSDTDYMVSSTTDGDKVRLRLSDPSGGVAAPLIVRYRCKRTGTQAANLIGRLYQGTSPGTLITTFTQLSVPDTFTTYTYTLTSGEFASITDFTDLYVEFELSQQSSLKVDLNFAGGVYYDSGTVANATGVLSCTRASTGYATNANGTLTSFAVNTLRIGVGSGLLVENARTNALSSSQDIDDAAKWNNVQNVTISANTTAAPDGTTTADTITPNTSNVEHYVAAVTEPIAGTSNVIFSVYVKPNGYNYARLMFGYGGFGVVTEIRVDLTTGTITGTQNSGSPTGVSSGSESMANGWVRIWAGLDFAGGAGTSMNAAIGPAVNSNVASVSFTGDGTSGCFVWGGQCEQGAFPSSYIATARSGSAATRAADSITIPQANSLGTILRGAAGTAVFSIGGSESGSVFAPAIYFLVQPGNYYIYNSIATTVTFADDTAGGNASLTSVPSTVGGNYSVGGSWNAGGRSVSARGLIATSAVALTSANTADPTFFSGGGVNPPFAYCTRFTAWNSRIADATLQAFTT